MMKVIGGKISYSRTGASTTTGTGRTPPWATRTNDRNWHLKQIHLSRYRWCSKPTRAVEGVSREPGANRRREKCRSY
ncbi:MAG: hypothetical protein QG597_3354 [Actinomycetota bacterium]|nr:hypothetical protein [Actinomycetota bacterium]